MSFQTPFVFVKYQLLLTQYTHQPAISPLPLVDRKKPFTNKDNVSLLECQNSERCTMFSPCAQLQAENVKFNIACYQNSLIGFNTFIELAVMSITRTANRFKNHLSSTFFPFGRKGST
jgi:hypothetical protein